MDIAMNIAFFASIGDSRRLSVFGERRKAAVAFCINKPLRGSKSSKAEIHRYET